VTAIRRASVVSLVETVGPWRLFLTCAFIVSRVWYHRLGFRFDVSPLGSYFQYVDPALLRHSLLESVWYMHSQPPLFNLFLGIVLKVFPERYPQAFATIFLGLGLILALAIHSLLSRTGVPSWVSALIALGFSVSPVAVLYENWLFYAHPVVVLVGLAVLFLQRYTEGRRRVDLVVFFALVTTLALTWAAFHLVWVVATIAVVVLTTRDRVREIALWGGVSLLLVGSVYAKNSILFGAFGCGSIYPKINLALMTIRHLPDLRRHVELGDVSKTSLISPYRGKPDAYGISPDAPTGIAVLDEVRKPDGHANWNNPAYLEIADRYYRDALWVVRAYPNIYLHSVWENVARYFAPATDTPPFRPQDGNVAAQMQVVGVFSRLFTGREGQGVGWLLVVVLPAALALGAILLTRRGRAWLSVDGTVALPSRATVGFCLGTVVYLFLVTVLISASDQSRYRYMVTPCYLVLVGQLAALLPRGLGAFFRGRRES
jgi:hypothetical protein